MKILGKEQKRYQWVTALFLALFLAALSGCGTTDQSDDVAATVANETGADSEADAAGDEVLESDGDDETAAAPDPSDDAAGDDDDDTLEAQLASKTDAGDQGDDAANDGDAGDQGDGAANDGDTEVVAPAEQDSTEPASAPPAKGADDQASPESNSSSDDSADDTATAVEAISTSQKVFTCPAGSTGDPSATTAFCTTTVINEFAATITEEAVCRNDGVLQPNNTCLPVFPDKDYFTYGCPFGDDLPSQQDNPKTTTQGSGSGVRCIVTSHKYDELLVVSSCNPGEVVERRTKFKGVSYPEGVDICTTPGLSGRAEPITLGGEYTCPEGWSKLASDPQVCTRQTQTSTAASGGKCSEGQPLEVNGKVTTCLVEVTENQDGEKIPVYTCPDGAVFAGYENDGRKPKCSYERWAVTIRSCPTGSTLVSGELCEIAYDEREIESIATPCPEGQVSIGGHGGTCREPVSYPSETDVRYSCPADAETHGSGAGISCSASRTEQVDAIARTVVEYSCPAGSTGQPTQNNPWCEKAS